MSHTRMSILGKHEICCFQWNLDSFFFHERKKFKNSKEKYAALPIGRSAKKEATKEREQQRGGGYRTSLRIKTGGWE